MKLDQEAGYARDIKLIVAMLKCAKVIIRELFNQNYALCRCVAATGERKEITITITDSCGYGQSRCKDGACIPEAFFCDGTPHCRDSSDEFIDFCRG